MVEFSGPEAKGFHDCFWIGPVSFESYNMAFPDEGAVYMVQPLAAMALEITAIS